MSNKNLTRPIILTHKKHFSNLKLQRIKKRITQKELSELSGVPLKSIGNYEQGFRNINHARADILFRMAKVLECGVEDLMELDKL